MLYTCLFCKSTKHTNSKFENTFFNNKVFSYLKCKSCGLIQVCPLPDNDDYNKMYSYKYYNFKKYEASGIYNSYFKKLKLLGNYESFLDFGCGSGKMIAEALNHNFTVTGTDIGSELILKLKSNYPNASFIEIKDFYDSNALYDIIFVSNVFEHLINPTEVLEKLITKLTPNGILIAEGPIENNFSIASAFRKVFFGIRKLLGKTVSHAPRHIFYSNYSNQLQFFKNSTLKVVEYNCYEIAWPFPKNIQDVKSISQLIFWCIAKLSIYFSRLSIKQGTVFNFIGKKYK